MSRLYSVEDVCVDFQSLHTRITQQTEVTQDGINISSSVDDLQEVLKNKLNTDYEISPVCMEAIKLAIKAIYSNVGATYSAETYATTNFSQHALENLSGFVSELWVRVKASMQTLWNKVAQFWEDNFSALQSVRKTLGQALKVIEKDYKVTTSRQSMRLPDGVFNAFNSKKDVDDMLVMSFIMTHLANFERLDEVVDRTKYFNHQARHLRVEDFEKDIEPQLTAMADKLTARIFKFGHDMRPMINGEYVSVEYNFESGSADMQINIDRQELSVDNDTREIYICDHTKLRHLVKRAMDVIDETIKYASIREKAQKEFDDLIHVYDKLVLHGDPMINKNVNKTIKLIYKINSSMPGFFSLVVNSNVKMAKAVLNYAGLCVKEA